MNNLKLEIILNKYFNNHKINDQSINGLQIGGKNKINKIITGINIDFKIIKKAISLNYNTIIVHHGILWKNKLYFNNINKKIIKKIIKNNINLFAWHLPLDIHKKIGNNIILAKKLNINIKIFPTIKNPYIIGYNFKKKNILNKFKIFKKFIFYKSKKKKIKKICLCCGNGNKFIEKVINNHNIDTYITGEISEINFNIIKLYDINCFILGHEKSEIYGIIKLKNLIKQKFNIKTYNFKNKNSILDFIIKN